MPAGVILDNNGNLYGTSDFGGDCAYELSPGSSGKWTRTPIGGAGAGCNSIASLIFDSHGSLYGTSCCAGDYGGGSVFRLTPTRGGRWKFTVLYSFQRADGQVPFDSVTFDQQGNLYGTTAAAGLYGDGAVFKLTPTLAGPWSIEVLHYFSGGDSDGAAPIGGVVLDNSGNLYGTTNAQGSATGEGVVFKLTPDGTGGWAETIIHQFGVFPGDGSEPRATLLFGKGGELFGTTWQGGDFSFGTVFKLTPSPNGVWTETIVYSFTGGQDGGNPYASVIMDSAGSLYGTAYDGGQYGLGTVFKIEP
jgi:uncharacterized repeat protein (TIGR03803 family)